MARTMMSLGALLLHVVAHGETEPSNRVLEATKPKLNKMKLAHKDAKAKNNSAAEPMAFPSSMPAFDSVSLSTESFDDFSKKTHDMEQQLTLKHVTAKKRLEAQRQAYETSLQTQKEVLDRAEAETHTIEAEISRSKAEAQSLKIEAEGLLGANEVLWDAMAHMLSKVDLAINFLELSVNETATADTQGTEQLLLPAKRDVEFYVNEARRSLTTMSLLEMRAARVERIPQDAGKLLSSLSQTLENVDKATAEGSLKLKEGFRAASAKLKERKVNLTQKQGKLMLDKAKAEAYIQSMRAAVNKMQDMHTATAQRMAGLQTFSTKLRQGVDSVLGQAKQMLEPDA